MPGALQTGQVVLPSPVGHMLIDNDGVERAISVILPPLASTDRSASITVTNVSAKSRLIVQASHMDRMVWNLRRHCSVDVPLNHGAVTVSPDGTTWSLSVQSPVGLV